MPAKAGIQNRFKIPDSGSPPAFVGVVRNNGSRLWRTGKWIIQVLDLFILSFFPHSGKA